MGKTRTGILETAHGKIETPAFLPLATKGAPKLFTVDDLKGLSVQALMANTFHIFLRPGIEVIQELGGLHRFLGWDGPVMTDSGGFQIFSMDHGQVFQEIKQAAAVHTCGSCRRFLYHEPALRPKAEPEQQDAPAGVEAINDGAV